MGYALKCVKKLKKQKACFKKRKKKRTKTLKGRREDLVTVDR